MRRFAFQEKAWSNFIADGWTRYGLHCWVIHDMRQRRPPVKQKSARTTAKRSGCKVTVEFAPSLYAEIEKAAAVPSITRSTLIRSAVQEYLEKLHWNEFEKQLAEGYIANASQARETAEAFSGVDPNLQ